MHINDWALHDKTLGNDFISLTLPPQTAQVLKRPNGLLDQLAQKHPRKVKVLWNEESGKACMATGIKHAKCIVENARYFAGLEPEERDLLGHLGDCCNR